MRNREKLLHEGEAAHQLGVSLRQMRRWRKAGLIQHLVLGKGGRLVKYRQEHLDDFTEERCLLE